MSDFSIQINSPQLLFSGLHFIYFDNGACEALHGHDFQVSAVIEAALNDQGYVVDFLWVEMLIGDLIRPWNHKWLLPGKCPFLTIDEQPGTGRTSIQFLSPTAARQWSFPSEDCVILEIENTTTEVLAQFLCRQLADALRSRLLSGSVKITLTESVGCSATCRIRLDQDSQTRQ